MILSNILSDRASFLISKSKNNFKLSLQNLWYRLQSCGTIPPLNEGLAPKKYDTLIQPNLIIRIVRNT